MTLNTLEFGVDWKLARLNSYVSPTEPAMVQYPFPADQSKSRWVLSDLRYGTDDPSYYIKKVNIIIAEREQRASIGDGFSRVIQFVEAQPKEEAVSKARLIVGNGSGGPKFRIVAEIRSAPPIEINFNNKYPSSLYTYKYEFDVQAAPLTPDNANELEELRIKPTSQMLTSLLIGRGYAKGEIPIGKTAGKVEIMSSRPWSGESEMAVTDVHILSGNKIVGSFPMSFYQPKEPLSSPGDKEGGQLSTEIAMISGIIKSIDDSKRAIKIRKADGKIEAIFISLNINRFDQFKVGDKVSATYNNSVSARLKAPGEPSVDHMGGSTSMGQSVKSGGTAAMLRTMTVTVTDVDKNAQSISVAGPNNWRYSRRVMGPTLLDKIKPGDKIDITWDKNVTLVPQ